MLTLRNNTNSVSRVGYIVTLDPRDQGAFIYATPNSTKAIGVVTEAVDYRKPCKIATIGETAYIFVAMNLAKDDIIRLGKSNDRVSLGTCIKAKLGDAPYLKIGSALSSGSGLILCNIELSYISGITDSIGLGAIADGTYTVGLGILSNGVIVVKNGIIISLTEAT